MRFQSDGGASNTELIDPERLRLGRLLEHFQVDRQAARFHGEGRVRERAAIKSVGDLSRMSSHPSGRCLR
jgi:hypothetical protein